MILRWLLILGLLFGAGAAVWANLPKVQGELQQGDRPLAFQLPDLQGKLQGLPKQGDVVLLNFWATWCPPCRSEIPSMAALQRTYAEAGLKVVAISVDQYRDDLISFVAEYKLPFQVLHDANSDVSRRYGVFRYPETFLIDRQGKVRAHLIGAVDWMSKPLQARIQAMLSEPK